MTEDNSTQHGSLSSGHTRDYIYPSPIFGPNVIRHSFGGDLYIAGEYIPEKLRGTKKREDRPPYEYANLRKLPREFPKEEGERKKQYLREHGYKD